METVRQRTALAARAGAVYDSSTAAEELQGAIF